MELFKNRIRKGLLIFLPTLLLILLNPPITIASENDSWPTWRLNAENTGFYSGMAPETNQTIWTNTVGPSGGSTRGGGVFPPVAGYGKIFIGVDGTLYAIDQYKGNIVWSQMISDGWDLFSPALAFDKVFISSDAGELIAIDQQTGGIIWRNSFPASPSINVYNGYFFIAGFNGTFYSVNATTGGILWDRNLAINETPITSHAAISNGRIFIGPLCLNETTGSTVWTLTVDGQQLELGANNFAVLDEGSVLIGINDTLYSLNQVDGSILWSRQISGDITLAPPAISEDKIVITSSDGNIYCLSSKNGDQLWRQFIGSGTIARLASTPIIANDKIYVNLNNEEWGIKCLDLTNGSVIWSYATAGPASQPIIANNILIVTLEHDPEIYAFGQLTVREPDVFIYLVIIVAAILIALFFSLTILRLKRKKR
jgi:outer membrane protein assembly factor BamB